MTKSLSDITLTIDIAAVKYNYDILRNMLEGGSCAAVVKANAYGLGVDKVAPALYASGCRDFFVATLEEGLELSKLLAFDAKIYVFHGVKKGEENIFEDNGLVPVLNDVHQLDAWAHKAKVEGLTLPAILHFDTGMNRLGFNWADAEKISHNENLKLLDIKYVMSHLACADEAENEMNKEQLKRVNSVRKFFPNTPVSLSNSWGILAAKCYHFDLARPGCALYGVKGNSAAAIKNVITASAKIIQIREISEDGSAGYGASAKVKAGTKLAVVPLGYADGYFRGLSNRSHAFYKGKKVPLVGRVSMDLTIFDITGIDAKIGDELELIGDNYTVDQVAENAGTIGYEVLTNLCSRYNRVYRF
jgi:alanine racemase